MRLPRQLSGDELASRLAVLGYTITRQAGSHLRLTCQEPNEHHISIPRHDSLRVGTLAGILKELQDHHQISREELLTRVFWQ